MPASSQHRRIFIMPEPLQSGLVIFPKVTQLDLTGPVQVFSSVPGAEVHLIWKRIEPVTSDSVLTLTPTITFADCPQLDVICVPGGFGTDEMVNDEEVLDFLRRQAMAARYITSAARGRWCWARPACSGATARQRTGPRWTTSRRLAPHRQRPASASTATASPVAA